MAIMDLIEIAYTSMAPLWVELSFLVFFSLGFVFLRADAFLRLGLAGPPPKSSGHKGIGFDVKLKKKLEKEAEAGAAAAVLATWRAGRARGPTPGELLKHVVQAFLDTEPEALVPEILDHMRLHKRALASKWVATIILDTVARSGNVKAMVKFWQAFTEELCIARALAMYEVVMGGFASAGHPAKVDEFEAQLSADRLKLSPRGFSLIIKGFLKNGLVDETFNWILAMSKSGQAVPSFALAQFFRVTNEKGRTADMFDKVLQEPSISMTPEALCVVLEECMRMPKGGKDLAERTEALLRKIGSGAVKSEKAFDSLLKVYTVASDPHALTLFKEFQNSGLAISEGLLVGLLARCAEGKFLRMADEVVAHCRANKGLSIAVYSALMKVYAFSGMYDKACDLYDQILKNGLEPDSMMYGCLMKFAVECGRTQLSQELAEKLPKMDIQNYMSLIRAAGRDRDIDRAFSVIQRLRASGMVPDVACYNCVLDVCVQAGNMARGNQLVREMKELGSVDIITYNTLLKGLGNQNDLQGAKNLLAEMESSGMRPNDISYNCLLNICVSTGNFHEAWQLIDKMEQDSIKPDHYTVSIMMKALKKVKGTRELNKCFALLDRSGIDPCSDEILLNTVLETCIRNREYKRLEALLASFEKASLRPSVPTYGSIIKAYSNLKRPHKCWHYWNDMISNRGLRPNDIVLGCMLDALVCNGQVDDAVNLFRQSDIVPNTVLYSILVKGFANAQQPERAMEVFGEMRNRGMKLNTVTYNSIIDAQARVGYMEKVSQLVQAMATEGCVPDAITHSTIVKGYCVNGDMEKAYQVINGMQESKMPHDAVVYNTILDGCTRHRRMDIADKVLEDMETYNICPTNFTLGILIKMYGRNKRLDMAFRVMESLPKRGHFVPNAQCWSFLMCACLSNNNTDKALQVFEDMKATGLYLNSRSCTSLINDLVRARALHQAIDVVDDVFGLKGGGRRPAGPALDTDCLESLLAAIAQEGLESKLGAPLLARLREAGLPVTGRLMASATAREAGGGLRNREEKVKKDQWQQVPRGGRQRKSV